MRANTRDARALLLGAVGVVAILVYSFVYAPLAGRWHKATSGRAKAEKRLELLQRLGDRNRTSQQRKAELAPLFMVGPDLQGSERYLPRLIDQLENLSGFDALQVERYDPVRAHPGEHYAPCSLTVVFHCKVDALQDFLYEVQQAKPILTVDRLSILPDKRQPGSLQVHMVVSGYLAQEKLLGEEGKAVG